MAPDTAAGKEGEMASVAATTNTASDATSTIGSWISDAFGGLARGELNEASTALLFKMVVPAAMALVMVIVTYFAAKLVSRWIAAALCKKVDETLGKFVGRLTFYGLMIVGSLAILSVAGISVAGAAAVLTAAGFAIGLAFQGTLSNFAAGVLLLVFRPFKVSDMVVVGGVTGRVNEIDLFTTTLDTTDNRRLILPNNAIVGNTIENVTFHKQRRVEVVVGVSYRADMDATRNVLIAAVEAMGEMVVMGEGRGYQIFLSNLGAHSVDWTIRVWVDATKFWVAREQLIVGVKRALDEHQIEIPFPQMHLHLDDAKAIVHKSVAPPASVPIPRMVTSTTPVHEKTRPRARGEINSKQ